MLDVAPHTQTCLLTVMRTLFQAGRERDLEDDEWMTVKHLQKLVKNH